jgi:hypothetical protein
VTVGPPPAPSHEPELVTVQLLGVPLALLERARQHHDSLEREFRLLTLSRPEDRAHVTSRLLDLVREVSEPAAAIGAAQADAVNAAYARGETTVDLAVPVPPAAAGACRRLGSLFAEADEFCRRGDLLNVATPPDCVELRHWYLGQFVAQIEGAPPTPWRGPV